MDKKVFISHSTTDSNLALILVDFLTSLGLSSDDIFCTSNSGSLEAGKNFIELIRKNVLHCKVVIFLMSERFFMSSFCLTELGAAWALNQEIVPIIVPPITSKEYNQTPLLGIQALNIGNADFALTLVNELLTKGVLANNHDFVEWYKKINDLTITINKEIKVLRKDSEGYYVARVIKEEAETDNETDNVKSFFLLDGILDIETNSNIKEHWIYINNFPFSNVNKAKFVLSKPWRNRKYSKVFGIESFYILP